MDEGHVVSGEVASLSFDGELKVLHSEVSG